MRQWVLENTTVGEEKYDSLLNSNTIKGNSFYNCERKNYTLCKDHPLFHIENFTYKKPTRLRCYLNNIKKSNEYYFYKDIKFKVLAKDLPKFKKELYSEKRKGQCFHYSIILCNLFKDSKITTALCNDWVVNEEKKYVHSFVTITSESGIEVVFDATLNIIMEKSKYLELLDAKIISEIDREKIKEDLEYLSQFNIDEEVHMPEYLCFPDQIMEGVKSYLKLNNIRK